jgi:pyridoxine kinase
MANILAISSQTAYGPVGNSAMVPALEWLGHTVYAVPTVILSHHPGHGPPAGIRMPARDLGAMLGALENLGVLDGCAAVFSGYFAADEQVHAVERQIARMKRHSPGLLYVCDPILGDDPDGLYVPLPVAEAVRDRLLPVAGGLAPNRFELQWLTGAEVGSSAAAVSAARSLPCGEVIATSVPAGNERIATIAVTARDSYEEADTRLPGVPHGTGDLLTGLYFGNRLNDLPPHEALKSALRVLRRVIAASAGAPALDLARGLQGGPTAC